MADVSSADCSATAERLRRSETTVDDPATVAYLASIAGQAQVLRYEGPFNFSAINNWAVAHLEGDYTHYLLCNNDIEAYEPGWLERMLELGQHPDVGIVGAQLFYPDR